MGARKYDHGRLWPNQKRRGPKDPHMLGTLYLNGSNRWSLAMYLHRPTTADAEDRTDDFHLLRTREIRLTMQRWSDSDDKTRYYGGLRPNPDKSKPKHPDYIGTLDAPKGQRLSVAAWVNVNPAGNRFLKLTAYPL